MPAKAGTQKLGHTGLYYGTNVLDSPPQADAGRRTAGPSATQPSPPSMVLLGAYSHSNGRVAKSRPTTNIRRKCYAIRRQRLAGPDPGRNPGSRPAHLRSPPPLLGRPNRAYALPALPDPRTGRRHYQRPQRPLHRLYRGPLHVPARRSRADPPRRRGGVRPGHRSGQRQRHLRRGPRRRRHYRRRQPGLGRCRGVGD